MHDAKIITLYKNKDARLDFNNHRGTSLLGIAGKNFALVILPRLFKPLHLKAKSRVKKITVRDLLFADNAALVAHSA